jgi:hypothetical protein
MSSLGDHTPVYTISNDEYAKLRTASEGVSAPFVCHHRPADALALTSLGQGPSDAQSTLASHGSSAAGVTGTNCGHTPATSVFSLPDRTR